MSQWKTNDDFELDLKQFSDIHVSADEAYVPPPPTIAQYSARMKQNTKSVFDTDDCYNDDDDEVIHIYSGRGRGCVSKIFAPGKCVSQASNDEESVIVRKIKEETGFIGYDKIVETKYKQLFQDAKEPESVILPTVEKQRNSSSVSIKPVFGSTTAETVTSNSTTTSPQLPLSVMMKRAKKKHKDVKSESDNSGSDTSKENSTNSLIVNDENKKHIDASSPRSQSSGKQWRSYDSTDSGRENWRARPSANGYNATESVTENWRARTSPNGNFAYSVKSDSGFRKEKVFNVQSKIDFPPLGQ